MKRRHPRHIIIAGKSEHHFSSPLKSPMFQYCCLAVILLCGVFWGSVLAGKTDISTDSGLLSILQEVLSKDSATSGFWNLFFASFFSSSLILCISFILGLCALGSPGHIALIFLKGTGIGLSMGAIYVEYGVKGFAICALFILPWALITSFSVMIACREGIRFSFRMMRVLLPSAGQGRLWDEFCTYSYKYIFCIFLISIAAIIQAFSSIIFSLLFFS